MKSPNSNLEDLFQLFLTNKRVCTDTRKIRKGDMFFALKGPNFDGNEYVPQALENGAVIAVSDNQKYENHEQVVVVQDALVALQNLAKRYRKHLKCQVIGLTGSNGKTTTKELCYQVLSSHYDTHCTQGNLNNHIGVPLTILSTPDTVDYLIVEMGANAQGEIKLLSEIASPDYGIITNIGKAHLEGFGGIEGVIKGKTELYNYLKKARGKIIVNLENEILKQNLPPEIEVIPYLPYELMAYKKEIRLKVADTIYTSPLYGKYNVENILAAITVGVCFKVPEHKMVLSIANYNPDNNRSTVKKRGKHTIFFDAYNANPTSVKSSLEGFNSAVSDNKIVILGDMLELGSEELKEHKAIMNLAESMSFNKIYFVGEIYTKLTPVNSFKSVLEFKKKVNLNELAPSNILLKGSRKIKLESIFSD